MAIVHVQTTGGHGTTSGQASFTSTATSFTAGNLLVAVVTWSTSSGSPSSITTPSGWSGGTFKANGGSNGGSWAGYMLNNPGGSQSWTWTESGGNAQGWSYTILEFSGVATSSALDLAIVDNATGSTSANPFNTGAATGTTAAGDLIIALYGLNRSTPPTITASSSSVPTSGWTVDTEYSSTGASPNAGSVTMWQVLGSGTTATNPSGVATGSSVSSYEGFLFTFSPAAGGGGGGPTPNPLELMLMSVG